MSKRLKDKVAIITGGSRGIGFATADAFLREGARVILSASTQESADNAVSKLKEKYPDVRLILVLPCLSQTRGWSSHDVEIYEDIKSRADKVVYTSEEYTRGCMHKRNRHLVDNSSACIAYLTDSKGGTAYTVDYANKHGLIVYNIADHI